ncbi:MAG TPA: UDP-N-acetylmuramate dehydrogenase [Puia sp.]|jgi:UDP-N-acetylmuramate dehydrogenase|nr:UDP-N-acetylmuramate dehydrogenase [Puia sp.]
MNQISENVSLKAYNTFGVDANARYYASFGTADELGELLEWAGSRRRLILGGGSNLLFTKDIDGIVLHNNIKGIEEVDEDEDYVYVRAGAGENWAGFVEYCIGRDWAGLENLSLIPGSVGAAPMQNIGAYGVELESVFLDLDAWSLADGKECTFTLGDCEFGYRDSIFKGRYRDQFVILRVTLRLKKVPIFHTSYGAIREELQRMGVAGPSIRAISQAVISIRKSKLPDPAKIGNAGSYFKNPTVPDAQFAQLLGKFPDIVGYPNPIEGRTKVAAGWMIEQCGWKGYRRGDAGVHERQALVLVNYGNASGAEIYRLGGEIAASVKQKFGVTLEREVNAAP